MAEIKIQLNETGQLQVAQSNDIAGNMVLTLGLLELAKHAVLEQAKQAQNRVQPATHLPAALR